MENYELIWETLNKYGIFDSLVSNLFRKSLYPLEITLYVFFLRKIV